MAIAFMFPGQGSQAVGMGKALAENFASARAVFDEVDAALGQNLSDLMWTGPEAELTLTENCQPALLAVSMAVIRVLEAEHGITVANTAKFVAGHSLGEYSALAAAGTFALADAARLLRIRGTAMQNATPLGTGAMAALLGLDFATASAVAAEAAEGDVCQAANDNSDGQVVISGHKAAVERAMVIAKAKGAKRAIMLTVSAPFHCALMKPAADVMAEALAQVAMKAPVVPVVANVGAAPLSDPSAIRDSLVAQVTGTVRWRECVGYMADHGVSHFYEIGSGRVLMGLSRKNAPNGDAHHVGTPEDITAAVALIKQG
ncbi:ACP S-malonyltransferase [Aestuariivirga sp.]|uniref:ACP S-malonyltransferase n=1 Tax=Aestuariivirga sp. TaxID=2650926 RepID=UPI0035940ED5